VSEPPVAPTAAAQAVTPAALVLEGVSKFFQGQRALDDLSLELEPGQVHALLGQNGSGKSTLIKILAGYHQPEPGARAVLHGRPFQLGSSDAAAEAGLRFIHQDLGLIGELDVAENLALGQPYESRWWLSERRERAAATRLLHEYGLDLSPSQSVRTLSAAQQTMVAIVRALCGELGDRALLVLDEPTAALPAEDVAHLFSLLATLRSRGATVLYVTHRLNEVFQIGDRVTVLRDGKRVTTRPVRGLTYDELAELIVGGPLGELYPELPTPRADVALRADDLRSEEVRGVSLALHSGEIVGLTGLVGSGHERVLHLLFGAEGAQGGEIRVDGIPLAKVSPLSAIRAGMAFAPADRKKLSAIVAWTVRENITLPRLRARRLTHWMSARKERRDAAEWIARLHVTPSDPERAFSSLSGGNQQRAVLARWLRCGARIFLLEEPTNGVDMGAKAAIYRQLAEVASNGAAILMTSSDAEELCLVCDRVLIMRDGQVATILEGPAMTVERMTSEVMRANVATPAARAV
jgi:ribose transport system ATP-binding protein